MDRDFPYVRVVILGHENQTNSFPALHFVSGNAGSSVIERVEEEALKIRKESNNQLFVPNDKRQRQAQIQIEIKESNTVEKNYNKKLVQQISQVNYIT